MPITIFCQQSASKVMMVKPAAFGFNVQTAASNVFQNDLKWKSDSIQKLALTEFEDVVKTLENKGVEVMLIKDNLNPLKPDAIFPNNWISFHSDGRIFLFPMAVPNRRAERRQDFIPSLYQHFTVKEIVDWSVFEEGNQFLEGTGSVILDRLNQIAYATLSPRTNAELFNKFCEKLDYKPVLFKATDTKNKEIYHTNVMMSIGTEFAVLCSECIKDEQEKNVVEEHLKNTNKDIVDINFEQVKKFAGNILELKSAKNKILIVMSSTALNAFTIAQKEKLLKYGEIVTVNIPTIEAVGGGGVRCMLAEMFLKK